MQLIHDTTLTITKKEFQYAALSIEVQLYAGDLGQADQ